VSVSSTQEPEGKRGTRVVEIPLNIAAGSYGGTDRDWPGEGVHEMCGSNANVVLVTAIGISMFAKKWRELR